MEFGSAFNAPIACDDLHYRANRKQRVAGEGVEGGGEAASILNAKREEEERKIEGKRVNSVVLSMLFES